MWLLTGSMALAASGFGGATVGVVGELDTEGAEVLADIGVRAYELDRGSLSVVWAPVFVSWGVVPAEHRLDRLEIGVLSGERRFSSGHAGAHFMLGELRYDQEDGVVDINLAEGGVVAHQLDDQLTLRVGADVHVRFVDTTLGEVFDSEADKDIALMLGMPLGADWEHPLGGPAYVLGQLDLRPSLGLAGSRAMAFDGRAGALIGLHVLDEWDGMLDVGLGYAFRLDTFTRPDPTLEHRLTLGMNGEF